MSIFQLFLLTQSVYKKTIDTLKNLITKHINILCFQLNECVSINSVCIKIFKIKKNISMPY